MHLWVFRHSVVYLLEFHYFLVFWSLKAALRAFAGPVLRRGWTRSSAPWASRAGCLWAGTGWRRRTRSSRRALALAITISISTGMQIMSPRLYQFWLYQFWLCHSDCISECFRYVFRYIPIVRNPLSVRAEVASVVRARQAAAALWAIVPPEAVSEASPPRLQIRTRRH